ncbi:MAG: ATP-binding protein [Chloroflexi bacterium]|nr:ATP-binding protein [Chloroflexota bacterium]
MATRVTDRLSAERRKRFVGREGEREQFQSLLDAKELPFQVLHIFRPGGVGKTTLLREFAAVAEEQQIPAFYVDARSVDPSPDSFLGALQVALGLGPDENTQNVLASYFKRCVIFVDTYETFEPLDGWIRDVFLPHIAGDILVVLASRNPPSPAWRSDPGWQSALQLVSLRNLSPNESRSYLAKCHIPPGEHDAVLRFTHGHPLALSLVADVFAQRPGFHFQPEEAPDVVKILLERFVQKVPGPAHRAALEACALVRVMTEALLATMLAQQPTGNDGDPAMPGAGAHELFEWLRGLSFVESNREGLFPHDLAREALAADLRWRNPDWYKELHMRARNYYSSRIQQTHGLEQQRILYDYVFLHRDNPVIRSMLEWQPTGMILPDTLRPEDPVACVDMVKQHEGEESAKLAAQWLERQPEGATVYRDDEGRVLGFIAMVALERASAAEIESDPATRKSWEYLQQHAPLRPGEVASHYRFWMAHDTYQTVSSVQTLIFLNTVRYQLTTPGLAFHFLPCAEPEAWAGAFAYANLTRLTQADYEVGGKQYGVYGHDWRAEPPLAWLQMLAEREVAGGQAAAPPPPSPPIVVLSKEEFSAAVREALRDLPRPGALGKNALVQSRIVTSRAGASAANAERASALQTALKEVTESLRARPREEKMYRALDRTFLRPAATQEQAAEELDLPFSTYRRHLKAGIDLVVESLWEQEIGR